MASGSPTLMPSRRRAVDEVSERPATIRQGGRGRGRWRGFEPRPPHVGEWITAVADLGAVKLFGDIEEALGVAWGQRDQVAVATAASEDEALHTAVALSLLGGRSRILTDDETARRVFANLPRTATLHDLGSGQLPDLGPPRRVFAITPAGDPPPAPRWLDRERNNLPAVPERFVGRHAELDAVAALLENSSLVTLVGMGGAGKTRLAHLAAARSLECFAGGAWHIAMAQAAGGSDVVSVIASVLTPEGPRDEKSLFEHLRRRPTLLVLDRCEEIDLAEGLDRLRRACPDVCLLATSRRPIGIGGEAVVPVSGLRPDEASELYLARATTFGTRSDDVDLLCERLEGLPMAVELAAARAPAAGPRELLVTLGTGDNPVVQAALQACSLLDDSARALATHLAALPCSVGLEALAGVAGAPTEQVLSDVERLVAMSLVTIDGSRATRYGMRDSVRSAITESSPPTEADARLGLLRWLRQLAEAAYEPLLTDAQPEWLAVLEEERPAIGAALSWGFENHPAEAAALAVELWRYWYLRGAAGEGRHWLERAVAADTDMAGPQRARLLNAAANLAVLQNDTEAARAWLEECVAIRREIGEPEAISDTLNDLAILLQRADDLDAAISLFTESVTAARQVGGYCLANALTNLGAALSASGDPTAGLETCREGLAAWEGVGLTLGIGAAHSGIAQALLQLHDFRAAREHLLASLKAIHETASASHVPGILEALAAASVGLEDPVEAARLLGAADELRSSLGVPVPADEAPSVEQVRESVTAALPPAQLAAVLAAGAANSADIVPALIGRAKHHLVREGDTWVVGFDGRAIRVRATKGIGQLATLLSRPGVPIGVAELAEAGPLTGADGAERLRKSVRKGLRAAIDHLRSLDEPLGRYLEDRVRTGTACSYNPLPEDAPWEVSA